MCNMVYKIKLKECIIKYVVLIKCLLQEKFLYNEICACTVSVSRIRVLLTASVPEMVGDVSGNKAQTLVTKVAFALPAANVIVSHFLEISLSTSRAVSVCSVAIHIHNSIHTCLALK